MLHFVCDFLILFYQFFSLSLQNGGEWRQKVHFMRHIQCSLACTGRCAGGGTDAVCQFYVRCTWLHTVEHCKRIKMTPTKRFRCISFHAKMTISFGRCYDRDAMPYLSCEIYHPCVERKMSA